VSDGTAPEGIELALKLCRKYKTRRCEKLERLEAYGNGTQYDGRPQFLEPADDVPLLDRAPCIVYPAVEIAISQHIDFAFGEGRFPKISTGVSEDDSKIDDLLALSEEDSATFDAFLLKLIDVTNFHAASDEALESGETIGSAISIVRADNGMLGFETVDAKYTTPAYDQVTRELVSITIEYPFVYEWIDPAGKAHAKCQIYRRVIDQIADVVFEPVDALESGAPVISTKEQARVDHKLGFCPVVWWPRKRGCKKQGVIDGHAIHEKLTDEMDAVNFELSQRFRAMLVSGDPQIYEIGVNKGEQVAPVAAPRASVMVDSQTGHGYFGFTERPRSSRRKGAGIVWRYENVEAKVGMLTIPPGVLKEMGDVTKDDIEILSQSLGYTRLETQGVRGAMSGKALAFLFVRTTAFVDKERRDIWDGWMAPSISMLARVGFTLASRGETLFVPGPVEGDADPRALSEDDDEGHDALALPVHAPDVGPVLRADRRRRAADGERVVDRVRQGSHHTRARGREAALGVRVRERPSGRRRDRRRAGREAEARDGDRSSDGENERRRERARRRRATGEETAEREERDERATRALAFSHAALPDLLERRRADDRDRTDRARARS
jgi:hypothetical protein